MKTGTWSAFVIAVVLCFCCKDALADTIVNGRRYRFIDHYPTGEVMAVGNFNDTLKTGKWIYFTKKGKVKARGRYHKGSKYGNWLFVDSDGKRRHKNWGYWNLPVESIEYDDNGELVLEDSKRRGPCSWGYRNGKVYSTARW